METEERPLKRGWTTGACAAAAAKAACAALLTGEFPDPVEIGLPGGQRVAFALAVNETGDREATAGIVKDAGDDPDVTHGALVKATVRPGAAGSGVTFRRGEGVGLVTRPGLPVAVGEPAINPVPRKMIAESVREAAGEAADIEVEISVPDGAALAPRTLNPRLGILHGISILGTTGVVIPYSCSAWIHSIHRGIDVARAMGLTHVAGSTGNSSEAAVQKFHGLHEVALIDMGDFVGGMLKYVRAHPVPRVTIAGGVAKMTKLAQGMFDVHSKRGAADLDALAALVVQVGGSVELAEAVKGANTVAEAFSMARAAGAPIGDAVAEAAWRTAAPALRGADVELEILVFDREGGLQGRKGFMSVREG
ncbi:cobalt-precorrin-5B (C(1))-methyltransferase [Mesorhizobium sp. LHD-90]|uniref:cobalt-precorrin-5B (C(1))-methyltransferase n=1 Tax=Mesorhizobium sp. LHD-90 TaxID=3071414 RepID=UPI0027DF697E|nr:cobalt-precorrin-5B (C(1))-methyltransferase [Mesorhizobium sp. LHD-90]MDQ6434424.1 cobalt-precorrin-5B (C(1))-methyltransferase [Mesorhizobium sp. LHD-90]